MHVLSDPFISLLFYVHVLFADLPFHSDLNRLVMDYLVIEGYKTAAEEFSRETGLDSPVAFESIESRMNIREALQRGDVSEAITRVNDLDPEVSLMHLSRFDALALRAAKGLNLSCTTHKPLRLVMILYTPKLQSSI